MKAETISIKNIKVQQTNILKNIFHLAAIQNPTQPQTTLSNIT